MEMKEETAEAVDTADDYQITKKGLLKFIIPSLFGMIIFLLPIKDDGAFNIPLGLITEALIDALSNFLPMVITIVIVISTLLSIISYVFKPAFITSSKMMASLFDVSTFCIFLIVVVLIAIIMTQFLTYVYYYSNCYIYFAFDYLVCIQTSFYYFV